MLQLPSHEVPDDLFEPVLFPSGRGNKKVLSPLAIDFQRELTDDDIDLVIQGPPVKAAGPVVRELKESHHRLAQLIATSNDTNGQIAVLSGYSETYIARLMVDPMFQGLVEQYGKITELKFRDTLEKMDQVGRDAVNELQFRIAETPEQFSNRELVEVIDSLITKPKASAGSTNLTLANSTPTINISFRTPQAQPDVIDVEIIK